ncbi:MAG: hypothetical protein ACRDJW_23130 [Thermomicrobiales bacterium]
MQWQRSDDERALHTGRHHFLSVLGLSGRVANQLPRLWLVGGAPAVIGGIGMACISTATLMAGQLIPRGNRRGCPAGSGVKRVDADDDPTWKSRQNNSGGY